MIFLQCQEKAIVLQNDLSLFSLIKEGIVTDA